MLVAKVAWTRLKIAETCKPKPNTLNRIERIFPQKLRFPHTFGFKSNDEYASFADDSDDEDADDGPSPRGESHDSKKRVAETTVFYPEERKNEQKHFTKRQSNAFEFHPKLE